MEAYNTYNDMKVEEIEYFEAGHVALMCMMHGKLVKIFLCHNEAKMNLFYQGVSKSPKSWNFGYVH